MGWNESSWTFGRLRFEGHKSRGSKRKPSGLRAQCSLCVMTVAGAACSRVERTPGRWNCRCLGAGSDAVCIDGRRPAGAHGIMLWHLQWPVSTPSSTAGIASPSRDARPGRASSCASTRSCTGGDTASTPGARDAARAACRSRSCRRRELRGLGRRRVLDEGRVCCAAPVSGRTASRAMLENRRTEMSPRRRHRGQRPRRNGRPS